jgi:hypothetical protein
MTTHTPPVRRLEDGWPAFAAVGVALSLMLTAFGTFAGPGSDEPGTELSEWLVVVAITLVAAVVVFGLVAKVVTPANAGTYALAFGLLGLASVVVFWAGLPVVLAFGALACAVVERYDRGRLSKPSMAAAGLAAVTVGAAIWLAVYG